MAPSARLIRLFASPIGSRAATTVFGRMPRTVGRARAALYTTGPTPPQTPSPGNSATTSGSNAGPGSSSGQGGPEPGSGSGPDSDSNSGTWSWFLGNQLGHPYRVLFSTIKYVALCHLLWVYVFTISPATGPSMFPTFDFLGDWIVISRLSRRGRDVRVGDIVCYDIPINNESGIKRVLGLPGDWVLLGSPGSYDGGKMIQVRFIKNKCAPAHKAELAHPLFTCT